ncbi:hypothetical protein IWW47_002331 [Coemansia sp. RSA 2052]|nr:hypothetical protein IWW47_002331 [Coemansia sp. RSA 2052]
MTTYTRTRFHDLKRSGTTQQALDSIWGDILVHRQALQDHCEELITTTPTLANALAVDRHLWKLVYYDAILECRKRLRLHTPPSSSGGGSSQSQGSSIAGSSSMRSSEIATSGTSADMPLDEWQREWWSVVLTTLFNEALGYFQSLYALVTTQLESTSALPFAIQHFRNSSSEPPPSFLIARRLLIYVGDIYRYQVMYLPQLAYGSAGPVDTTELLDLARCTYARASAMHFDSGRACMQMSLLAACAHQRFSAMFWHMCGLCYADHQHMRTKAMILATSQDHSDNDDDPIELLVVELAQAVVTSKRGGGRDTDKVYRQLLHALNEDLEEMRHGAAAAVVNLDADFWEREYQLGVALAALLTMTEEGSGDHSMRIQDLAVVLVQRQAMCLQQALELGETKSSVYPAISLCVWVDLWRSTTRLLAAGAPALVALLGQLIDDYPSSSGGGGGSAEQLEDVARTVLAHDVSLMGWRSLRSVQQSLRYDEIGCERLWPPDPQATVRVVLARAQLLLCAQSALCKIRSCVVPDFEFWCQRLTQVQKWAQPGGKYAVVLAAAVRQQLEADGGAATRAALGFARAAGVAEGEGLAQWEDAMAYLADGDSDDDERPAAADVPEEARAVLSCALRHQQGAAVATCSEELAFYASWFGVPSVSS